MTQRNPPASRTPSNNARTGKSVQKQTTGASETGGPPGGKPDPRKNSSAAPAALSVQPKKKALAAQAVRSAPAGGLPAGRAYNGLKMPKAKGPDQIQKRLQKKSPWYNSILDPLHGADCKIPDETGVETGTLQCVHKVAVTAGAGGVIGACLFSPYPSEDVGVAQKNYALVSPTSTSNNILWGSTNYELETTAPLIAYAQSTRIVSAAIYVQSEASLSSNQGVYNTFAAGFPVANSLENFPRDGDTLDFIQNHYKSAIIPVNNNRPAMSRWYPVARDEKSFKDFFSVTDYTEDAPLWTLMIVGSGLAASSVHEFTIVVNYEFIPMANSVNILNASPSPKDATETDLVENWVQEMDVGAMSTTRNVSSSPSAVNPKHEDEPSGFGMFASVIGEILPFALALL